MELKVNDYFEDSKRRNREEFRERVRQIKAQRHEFLKHLLSIHATILGFSVGLRAATGEPNTNPTLVIAWSIQILVLVLGTTVIKAQLDSDEYRARKASDFLIDMAEILQMEEQGCFDGQMEKRDGLITAALVQMMPHLDRWAEEDLRKHSEYAQQLPSGEFPEEAKETPFSLWIKENAHKLGTGFCFLSLLAFAFLFLAIVTA
jgi:hypothetical protein